MCQTMILHPFILHHFSKNIAPKMKSTFRYSSILFTIPLIYFNIPFVHYNCLSLNIRISIFYFCFKIKNRTVVFPDNKAGLFSSFALDRYRFFACLSFQKSHEAIIRNQCDTLFRKFLCEIIFLRWSAGDE